MIPFQNIDPNYLRELDAAANEVRAAVKKLKLLILAHESAESPAYQWAEQRHGEWRATCSLTCKEIRALNVRPASTESAVTR